MSRIAGCSDTVGVQRQYTGSARRTEKRPGHRPHGQLRPPLARRGGPGTPWPAFPTSDPNRRQAAGLEDNTV